MAGALGLMSGGRRAYVDRTSDCAFTTHGDLTVDKNLNFIESIQVPEKRHIEDRYGGEMCREGGVESKVPVLCLKDGQVV